MKCLACGAAMRLMDVRTDTTTVCGIERHTFRCSACAHTAQRLMLNRVRMPITNLPVVIPRNTTNVDLTRLSISRCAVWAQAEHRRVWRSIPHSVVVSVRTPIRRISPPHAKHFIAAPG